jgi:hypothetical protein
MIAVNNICKEECAFGAVGNYCNCQMKALYPLFVTFILFGLLEEALPAQYAPALLRAQHFALYCHYFTIDLINKVTYNVTMKGKIPYLDGYYEGDIVDGKPHGKGKYYDKHEEAFYTGDFVDGKMTGKGRYSAVTYEYRYEGDFVDGEFHGKGKLVDEGEVYEGDFFEGYFHGYGKRTYRNKVEEGRWEKDKFVG